eukprot:scaffold46766_cov56-Phaeocystis_antarctica.AAC.2
MPSRAVHKDASTVPPMPRGAFIKEEEVVPLMQLLDAVVKWEHAFVADEGGRSEGLPKRRDTDSGTSAHRTPQAQDVVTGFVTERGVQLACHKICCRAALAIC